MSSSVSHETIYMYMIIIVVLVSIAIIFLLGDIEIDGFLNTTSIFTFLLIFSMSGFLLERYTEINALLIIILSIVAGYLCTTLANIFLFNPLKRSESSMAISEKNLVGRTGKVLSEIPISGMGEIIIEDVSGKLFKRASQRSDDAIKTIEQGELVEIIEIIGGTAIVIKIRTEKWVEK